jgi:hypothetical protein
VTLPVSLLVVVIPLLLLDDGDLLADAAATWRRPRAHRRRQFSASPRRAPDGPVRCRKKAANHLPARPR